MITSNETVLRDIEYSQPSGIPLLLDIHIPDSAPASYPLIVWLHGGAWEGGGKEWIQPTSLLQRGYAVASVNYRLSSQATFPAQLEDVMTAIRFLRTHAISYRIDPTRVGIWGESAGGHLAALTGVSGDHPDFNRDKKHPDTYTTVQAVCDWFGPTDLCHWDDMTSPAKQASDDGPIARLLGAPIRKSLDLARKASPIHYLDRARSLPPFLIMHGDIDDVVPLQQSRAFVEALTKAGQSPELHIIPGAGHGFDPASSFITTIVCDFFDRHVKCRWERAATANQPDLRHI